jgi:cell division protein FtsB
MGRRSAMITTRKSKNGRSALFLTVCVALIGYFAYHAVQGEHGLHKRALLEQRVRQLEADLAMLVKERQRIEHDVSLITQRVKSQPDLLDEQARALLNYAHPDEIVVLRGKGGEPD